MKLVECVPNFSEGRSKEIIDYIASEIAGCHGITLLDVDPGAATNRTVYTFIGSLENIVDAAFVAIKAGVERIDMRHHKGAHPRQGACDVCPFIPIGDTSMEECVRLSEELGERVGRELGVPVYLYEYSARRPSRKSLQDIRVGEYEALAEKAGKEEWLPDFGPAVFNEKAGATVIGARDFLIAYNINLNTKNKKLAKSIAERIRDSGRIARDENGKRIRGEDGAWVRIPGAFDHCKATGWFIDSYGRAQVTMNLTNYRITPPHLVFDAVCELADEFGVRVTGSEIVGLVPLRVMLDAGRYYLRKQGSVSGVPDEDVVEVAVQSLGLRDVASFDARQKVIEWRVGGGARLMGMTCRGFVDELSRDSPAPGGGSVAALCGALSGGLVAMVSALTHGKKGYEAEREVMEGLGLRAQVLKERFIQAVDDDTAAFEGLMSAFALPKRSEVDKAARAVAIEMATKAAIEVPLGVLGLASEVAELASEGTLKGNRNSVSDAGVAGLCARTCALGAYYNVMINLAGISDGVYRLETRQKAETLLAKVISTCDKIESLMKTVLVEGLKQGGNV